MRISEKNLEKILPHDYPMILIDELLEVDTNKNTEQNNGYKNQRDADFR